jgi:predicted AlkP superfamily phosphohydrolase/phosphomutase
VRLNLIGREPHGIVGEEEREALLAELTADLEQLTDAETGEPAVRAVLPMAEIAPGSRAGQMPDALVSWTPGRRIRAVRHPRVGIIDDGGGPYARSEHNGNGFLVAAGPGIAAGATPPGGEEPREIDVAPTILHMFGCPVPAAVQGRPLGWLLADAAEPKHAEIDLSAEPAF